MLCLGWSEGIRTFHNIGTTEHGWATFVETGDYRTGPVSVHDVAIDQNGAIWFLNTLFSALCTLKPGVNFAVEWVPPFVGAIGPHDYCHLNGMAFADGRPQYFTALATTAAPQGWRENVMHSGVLLSSEGHVLIRGLSLPHSPQITADGVIVVEAGNGCMSHIDPNTGQRDVILRLPGVVRGADSTASHIFVGSSKVRSSSGPVAEAIAERIREIQDCRLSIVDRATAAIIGHVELPMLQEISTVAVLPVPGLLLSKMAPPGEAFTYAIQV